MRHFILAGALALACLQPAVAQDACKPLQMLGSAALDIAGDSVIVNVTINGKPAKLLLAPLHNLTAWRQSLITFDPVQWDFDRYIDLHIEIFLRGITKGAEE